MAVHTIAVMKRDNRTNDKAKRRKGRCIDCCHSNLSDIKGKRTSSSIATILREWNLLALAKGRKWNLRRVRDVTVVRRQLR